MQALSSPGHSDSEFYAIVRRQTNMVAHTVARAVCSWVSHRIFNSYSSCIEHWLINDNN